MDGFDVGGRLRTVREARGFSQRGLAKAAGISNATVSQIESNAVNPSVGALKRILDAIPMALSDFFAVDSTPGQVFFRASELKEIGRGGVSYRQVGKDLTGRALQLIMERYEAGADSGRIPLKHQGEEAAIILRGQLEVTVGDRREVLGPGDAYYFTSSARRG